MSGFEWESERLGIPFGMGSGFMGDDWGHPGPQRVTIVYQGKLGLMEHRNLGGSSAQPIRLRISLNLVCNKQAFLFVSWLCIIWYR